MGPMYHVSLPATEESEASVSVLVRPGKGGLGSARCSHLALGFIKAQIPIYAFRHLSPLL